MLSFYELTDTECLDFEGAMEIYIEAFPAHERPSIAIIKDRINSGAERLIIGKQDDKVGLMALLWKLASTRFILLDFLATAAPFRGTGIGGNFMEFIMNWTTSQNENLLFEVEHPDFGENTEQRLKRIRFYEKYGANTIKDVIYYLPDLEGGEPKEMLIMTIPAIDLDLKELKQVVKAIYQQLYSLGEGDEPFRKFILSLELGF
ncbi:GNAT family N-acetyltransferase [Solitalea sp. MAHUQ-68]|uniref:GNAT family N-acetyltransferase n=1 Tax=Solitalea agri TaxID=2953739 RepID=A0A9X2JBQ2_9SPHI|nr:GNAT family N-acetyltransferase [Solitalea agri]MCO4292208.1 GNAT family N-acetyltransferase [Solitalea agri]